jgi:hypothetical protein
LQKSVYAKCGLSKNFHTFVPVPKSKTRVVKYNTSTGNKKAVYDISSSGARRIAIYPRPTYYELAVGLAGMRNVSKAEIGEEAMKEKFDKMSPEEQARILKFYRQMTEEERMHPQKIRTSHV